MRTSPINTITGWECSIRSAVDDYWFVVSVLVDTGNRIFVQNNIYVILRPREVVNRTGGYDHVHMNCPGGCQWSFLTPID